MTKRIRLVPLPIHSAGVPAAHQFHGLDTFEAQRSNLLVRMVDDYVVRWPQLTLEKNIDIGTDLTIRLGLQHDLFAAGAENIANWDFLPGGTNLVLASVARVAGNAAATLTFDAQIDVAKLEMTLLEKKNLTLAGPAVDAIDPEITITLTGGDEWAAALDSEDIGNWSVNMGDTALVAGNLTRVSDTVMTLDTTGTTVAGTIELTALAASVASALPTSRSVWDTDAETSTADVNTIDPQYLIEITANDTFTAAGTSDLEANWTIDYDTSALVFGDLLRVDDTNMVLITNGTVEAGVIEVQANAAALVSAVASGELKYYTISQISTCTNKDHVAGIVQFIAEAAALDGTQDTGQISFIADTTDPGGESKVYAKMGLAETVIAAAAEDPTQLVVWNYVAFARLEDMEDLDNWNYLAYDSGLDLVRIEALTDRRARLHFEGTAVAGATFVLQYTGAQENLVNWEYAELNGAVLVYEMDEIAWADAPYVAVGPAGDVRCYQWIGGIAAYAGVKAQVPAAGTTSVYGVFAVNPKVNSAFTYEADGAETGDFHVFAWWHTDV